MMLKCRYCHRTWFLKPGENAISGKGCDCPFESWEVVGGGEEVDSKW